MYYKLTNKRKPTEKPKNLSLEDFLTFIGKNPIEFWDVKSCEGELDESGSILKSVSLFKNNQDELDSYKKCLSLAQLNDIHVGNKEIKFSKEIGFYLVRTSKNSLNEIHYSESMKPKTKSELERMQRNIASCDLKKESGILKLHDYCTKILDLLNIGAEIPE